MANQNATATETDGTLEIPAEKIVWMLELNDSMSPKDNNRRVVKIWQDQSGWNWEVVRQQARSHQYHNSNPHFVKPEKLIGDNSRESWAPPQRRITADVIDVPELSENRTEDHEQQIDDAHDEVMSNWRADVKTAAGGQIELSDHQFDFDPETGKHTETVERHRLEVRAVEDDD